MNKYFYFIIYFLFLPLVSLAQQLKPFYIPEAKEIKYSENSPYPQYLLFYKPLNIPLEHINKWLQFRLQLSSDFKLKLIASERDNLGLIHYRYIQTHNEVPIQGSIYIIHMLNNKILSMNGELYDMHNVNNENNITPTQAIHSALNYVNADKYLWEVPGQEQLYKETVNNPLASLTPHPELYYVFPKGNRKNMARLAYKVDIYAYHPLSRQYIFIDANTSDIIHTMNLLHDADAVGTAATKYSNTRSMITDSYTGGYRLRESGRGNGIETYNLATSTTYTNTDFVDTDNNWTGTNPAQDEASRDAHWGAEMTYDYYLNILGRNSIDDLGFLLRSYVHYSTDYLNAFWDGIRMTYGDGSSGYTALTCLDIVGHEITHGLTQYTAALEYSNESGALNESYSDCLGAAIEFYAKPPFAAGDWTMGEEIGTTFRSMSNPNAYGDPDTYLGTNWYIGGADNGGVHTNSGVMNKWFYILSIGESGTNDVGDVYSVTGLGVNVAAQILYRAMTYYMFPNGQYSDMRFYCIQAAMDLYGPNCDALQVVSTTNAWYAVNVGDPWSSSVNADFTANVTASCSAPQTVLFTNLSSNAGSYFWDFGDGNTSTDENPSHLYTSFGTFNVTLIADGGTCGTNTEIKSSYIDIDPSNPCLVSMIPSGDAGVVSACNGTLYDNGGSTANYYDNNISIITITPTTPAASITATFSLFDFEDLYDFLYIYDGVNDNAPCLGFFTGTTIPPSVTAFSGSMTIKLVSDPYVNGQGFVMNWTCTPVSAAPMANFKANYNTSCDGRFDFTDLSSNLPTAWYWDFGDGNTSILQNPKHTYFSNGSYTVTLTATNSLGSDTELKTNYVIVNRPSGPITTGASRCDPGSVTLSSTGSDNNEWFSLPSSTTVINTGTTFTTPFLSSTTTYHVSQNSIGTVFNVGPVNNTFGGGGYLEVTSQYLEFNVLVPLRLKSVKVYANGGINRTIQLLSNTGILLKDTTLYVPDGVSRINLNWDLPVQNGLRMGGVATMQLDRRNTGASYPYTVAGKISLTGTSAGSGYYYFYYDWELQEPDCISQRTPVVATINSSPSAIITPPSSTTICNGDSITLSANTGSGFNYAWQNDGIATGTNSSNIIAYMGGSYTVTITDTNGCTSGVSTPISLTFIDLSSLAISGSTTVCPGATATYSVTAISDATYDWYITGASIVSGCGTSDTTCTVIWGTDTTGNIDCIINVP